MDTALYNRVYNRKKRLLENGTALVQIEVYYKFKKKYFSTGIYLKPEQWDSKHKTVKNHPNELKINRQISDFTANLQSVELDRRNAGKTFNLDILSNFLNGNYTKSFTDFIENEIKSDKVKAKRTIDGYKVTLNILKLFKSDVSFDELTFDFLTEFRKALIQKGNKPNTIHKYFKNIRKFVNLAIDKDLFSQNNYPFRRFKIKCVETKREYLTSDEIKALENLTFPSEQSRCQKVLDMFLFSCYTGLRFSDLCELSRDKIKEIEGNTWIDTTAIKTGERIQIPINLLFNGKAIKILKRYENENTAVYFGKINNQTANNLLREIIEIAEIQKHITFHIARHTHATNLLYKRAPITTVQQLLGHRNLKTTQVYAKVINETIINDLSMINFD